MFGLGFTELLFVGLVALILIGPEELPKVARTLGRFLNEIKNGSDSFKEEFRRSTYEVQNDLRIQPPDFSNIHANPSTPSDETTVPPASQLDHDIVVSTGDSSSVDVATNAHPESSEGKRHE